MVLIDLCAALMANRATLLHVIDTLQGCGCEVAVWSALSRPVTRDALREAALLEAFDDVYALDHMMSAKFDYQQFASAEWISFEQLQSPVTLMRDMGVPEHRLPRWLGWVS